MHKAIQSCTLRVWILHESSLLEYSILQEAIGESRKVLYQPKQNIPCYIHVTLCYHMLYRMLYHMYRAQDFCLGPGQARAESCKQDLEEAPNVSI